MTAANRAESAARCCAPLQATAPNKMSCITTMANSIGCSLRPETTPSATLPTSSTGPGLIVQLLRPNVSNHTRFRIGCHIDRIRLVPPTTLDLRLRLPFIQRHMPTALALHHHHTAQLWLL